MSDHYRIMVEGEDHTLFCYKNDVPEEDVDEMMDRADNLYSALGIWAENETQERQSFIEQYYANNY